MNELIIRASKFAIEAHGDQKRKYTGLPYWVHLRDVATIVLENGHYDFMVAAAWLHDTIEDTGVTKADIKREFGGAVADLVMGLTDVSKPEDGNRQVRKAIDRRHLANGTARIQTIKCADLISNTRDIVFVDHPDAREFAGVYLEEKRQLLVVMTKADQELRDQAWLVLAKAEKIVRNRWQGATK